MLDFDATHRLGGFELAARFSAGAGLTVLFGRSGAGKTTIVDAIAGLLRPQRGRIALDGAVLLDTERGVFVPRHRRRIGYVFQEPRLFPHLSVRQNLLFGRWFTPRQERRTKPADIVELLGIGHLLDRRTGGLSGGEKQRVAIGRALLADPRLLLMDEPLAALDAARKEEILPYVERLRDEARVPIVYVSHSVAEVARLATTMVLVSDGRVDAVGPVSEVMSRLDLYPKTGRFEAGAVLDARVHAHDEGHGLTTLAVAGGEITVPRLALPLGAAARIRIRARDVIIATSRPQGLSALNILPGRIAEIAALGSGAAELRLTLAGGASLLARLTRRSVEELGLVAGRDVFAVIKTVALDRHGFGPAAPGGADEVDA